MNFISHTNNKAKACGTVAAALTMLLSTSLSAFAQDASSLNGTDDSLLPPEVVPLDPATANSMSAQQAAQRQASIGGATSAATEGQQVPGLVNTGIPNGMVKAQDARAAAFNALYGQGQLPQQPLQAAGGVSQFQYQGQNAPMLGNGSGSGPYGSPTQPPMPTQSQRLSGAPKNQPKIRDIKRAGFSNGLSAVATLGAGAIMTGALMRPTNLPMQMGMFGLTMTGFGVRNAFRF